jgi:hypothetical protein
MNKNYYLVLLLVAATSLTCFAQKTADRKGYIGLSFGISAPLGSYGSASGDYESNGYARGGSYLNLAQFNYQINQIIGVNACWFGVANPIDVDKIQKPSGATVSSDKPAGMGGLLAGITLKKDNFPIFGRVSIGYAGVRSGEITMRSGGASAVIQQSDMTIGLGYMFGAGALFQLGSRFGMMMSIDYLGTTAKAEKIKVTSGSTVITSGNQTFSPSALVLQLGVGYMFK